MKRNKFLSGVGAKLVLAMLTLSSAMFTSCEKEDFSIEVAANPAKVIINTSVIFVDSEGNAKDVTSISTISYSNATLSGTQGIIEGTESSPAISATTVTVTASYNGISGSQTISVAALSAGSSAAYSATIILAEALAEDSEYSIVTTTIGTTTETIWGSGTYYHDGNYWNENASEYLISVDVTYPIYSTNEVTYYYVSPYIDGYDKLTTYIENFSETISKLNYTGEASFTYQVSAYSIYAAYITKTTETVSHEVYCDDTRIATVYVKTVSSTKAEVVEDAHPDHASHYSHGHGHSHGDSTNAGGGIVIAD